MKQRLQKILSMYGETSRRRAEELIAHGQVKVNGRAASVGDSADPDADAIEVCGRPLALRPEPLTILLHKPRGVVTTMSDEKGRRTVADLVADIPVRLVPVGRLDIHSEGLLLMTNDGALIQKLTHPSHQVEKEYHVWVKEGDPDVSARVLSRPMVIEGHPIRPAHATVVKRGRDSFVLSIVIREGRHHQVRLMCAQAGLIVARLRRVRVGTLNLRGVTCGQYRKLTSYEIKRLVSETP